MIRLNTMGLDTRHIGDFCIDRPNGSGDYLLIIFKTNALLSLGDETLTVPPDSAIIYNKGTKQLYRTLCGNYVNHFLHFDIDNADDLSDIKLNTLLMPSSISGAEELIKMLSREQLSDSPDRARYIDLLLRLLLLKICDEKSNTQSAPLTSNDEALRTLRAEIYSNAGQFTSVAQLAAKANLSLSHFQQLYKTHFGISCYDDLLSAKVKTAQYYLSSSALSIKEIATICGYENDVCFMRRFKQRVGLTPSEYRRKITE